MFNDTGAAAYLHAWMDLNGDGVFNNGLVTTSPGERLGAARVVGSSAEAQVVELVFTVPSWAVAGAQRGLRLRLTNLSTTGPVGASGVGEVDRWTLWD